MASCWWAAHVLAISPRRRRHCSLLSLQSPVKMAEPAWNPWKAYSLFWRRPPHSSCLCDPITTVHYPPPTRTRPYVLSANVDSALCSTTSRAGSADWCHLKEEEKNPPCANGCVHVPACLPAASPAGGRMCHSSGLELVSGRREVSSPREMLIPFDWHPVTDTNAMAAKANVTVANWLD